MNIFKRLIVNGLANSHICPLKIRLKLYNLMGIKIFPKEIRPNCYFNSEFVSIGQGSFVNYFSQFHSGNDMNGKIELGVNCYVGMNVTFCTISHEDGGNIQRAGRNVYKPIKVGNGSWIGANCVILPGVTIGEGCIIAAGSIIIKDCESNSLYAGNPAIKKKSL
ncbi:maltose O-acetyltransferase [Paenibacillus sp. UNCCL117]|uniref:acyltransferase n=1 Tax=unclassified Paenibacillus TaxID=185978 RepID=UPI0008820336|nr:MULTISPECIES: acyltransferase [unclassified Paenibacillus]SDC04498.1 maltose O-acetyltransferase [Paenibacillus sp. cl123]SFW37335.1 maltose O-acetyltransferase [Paenibacillus sp. UNCCL117]